MNWHTLTREECLYSEEAVKALASTEWAKSLAIAIGNQGGCRKPENRPLTFEARVCYAALLHGIEPDYEFATGIGASSVDLRISGSLEWLIELVSADENQSLQEATSEQVLSTGTTMRSLELRSDSEDQRFTEGYEMVKLQAKLYEKVCQKNSPHKFPEVKPDIIQIILCDARGFLGGEGPDEYHIQQLCYGPSAVPGAFVQFVDNQAVRGIFEESNSRQGAKLLRERIHLIGFCIENEFGEDCTRNSISWCSNPFLVPKTQDELQLVPSFMRRKNTPA